MRRSAFAGAVAGTLALVAAVPAAAQTTEPAFLEAGAMAPDFSIPGGTRWGNLDQPVRLSDFRGKTVVLAFFPAARTRGCTIQMQTYRDEYQRVFNGGRDVVLIAISHDPVDDLTSWARDEDFPFLFGSDEDGSVYRSFGGVPNERGFLGRTLVVIDEAGKIVELVPRFREVDPTSYDELAAVLEGLRKADGQD